MYEEFGHAQGWSQLPPEAEFHTHGLIAVDTINFTSDIE